MSTFGILSSFDHSAQEWKAYKSRLSQWFIANDIDDKSDATGKKRRAILLSALTEATYKLASDLALPKDLQDVPYEDIVKILDEHFTPKKCGFSERHKFYSAVQQQGETHPQWVARLRGLTADCEFTNVEEALRDRFVLGMLAGPEKEKLFSHDMKSLTLAKAVQVAGSIRSAQAGAAAAVVPERRESQLYRIKRHEDRGSGATHTGKEMCSVCGRSNHNSTQCRFINYKCKKCHKKGHLRIMCEKVKYVGVGHVNEGNNDDGKLLNIRSVCGEPMTEVVIVGGIKLNFEVDTGSAVTVINEKTYRQYFNNTPLSHTVKRLLSYTGDVMECLGIINLPIQYNNKLLAIDIYVIQDGGPPLLGRDFLSAFQLQLHACNFIKNSKSDISELQKRFPVVFSETLGKFNKYEIKLRLKDDAKPIYFKARPIAFALRNKIDKEIDRLVSLGILKPVEHAEYASPIVPVLKRDGSVRICADYSVSINKQLFVEQYPLPTVNELFAKLYGGRQFSKLDLSMAYNQFVLDKESQNITCINTHRGLFVYTRMVFGLSSAPAIFQRAMESILSGIDGVLCLLDDVLITADNSKLHLERLHSVLQRLQDAGLTLQRDKCEFFKDEINYLGYVINKNGLKKSPDKVKAILNAPLPDNVNKLQSFLGLVNYYRNFVPDASSVLSPLYDLLKKGVTWIWNKSHNDAFCKIKKILASDKVLAHYNSESKLILTVDASPNGLGAVLSQVGEDGAERPVSFASRTLNLAEKRYAQIQKEATAIVFGVKRFHQYLYGRAKPFILRTDHKPLVTIFGPHRGIPEVSANRLQRYAIFLSAYNYVIEYIRSADNCADYLSRASLPDGIDGGGQGYAPGPSTVAPAGVDERAAYVNFVFEGNLPVTLDKLREHTRNDVTLDKVIKYVLQGWPKKVDKLCLKPYHKCRLQLAFENGCLMKGHKVVIPQALQGTILTELHHSHLGIVKTKAEARSRFWFPGIDNAIEKMISACNICIQLKPTPPRAPLATWEFPPKAFYRVHLDFLGPINKRMYLIIVDAYSKWVEVYDTSNSCASSVVIEKLCEFISRFGVPHTVVSDNGLAFTSHEFHQYCLLNGITHITSPAYHPASNGQAESYVKIVKKGLRSSLMSTDNNQRNSKLNLLKYLFHYRNSVHSVTGFSPAQIIYGENLRSRLDLINPKSIQTSPPSFTCLIDRVKQQQCSQNKYYGGNNKQCYNVNDKVLFKKYLNNNKFVWCQGIVLKRLGKVLYLIKDIVLSRIVKKHKNQIVLYRGDQVAHSYDYLDGENDSESEPCANVAPNATPAVGGEEQRPDSGESPPLSSSPSTEVLPSRSTVRLLRPIPRVDYKE